MKNDKRSTGQPSAINPHKVKNRSLEHEGKKQFAGSLLMREPKAAQKTFGKGPLERPCSKKAPPVNFAAARGKFPAGQNIVEKKQIHSQIHPFDCPTQRARFLEAHVPQQNKIMHSHLSFTSRYSSSSADYLRPGQQIRRRTRMKELRSIFQLSLLWAALRESWSVLVFVCAACSLFIAFQSAGCYFL